VFAVTAAPVLLSGAAATFGDDDLENLPDGSISRKSRAT
jgi:hypothetical protein